MTATPTCRTCRFFKASWALCLRYPPQVVPREVYPDGDGGRTLTSWTQWPEVRSEDWCGEWQPAGLA